MTSFLKFNYTNGTEIELRVIVEPWAEQFVIKPGQLVEILVQGANTDDVVEIEQLPTGLTVYGYHGCIISISSNGKELVPSAQKY